MREVPKGRNAEGTDFTVSDFYEAGRVELGLELVAGGKNLGRKIEEPIVNRPGLALTGFYEHFAWKRLQLLGKADLAYLRSLDNATRLARLAALFDLKAFCFVITNGSKPLKDEVELFEKTGAVLLVSTLKTRDFARKCTFVMERLSAPRTSIYGTMVEVCGLGVMFEGDPGLGKSETALGLIRRGYALVADDLTCIRRGADSGVLYGSASDSTVGFMEIRGIGILHVPSIFGIGAVRGEKRLQLVITFKRLKDVVGEIDRVGQTRRVRTILGVDIPNIIIPVSEGRDLVNLVETAAQQQKLIMTGYDPVEDLSERLRQRADKKRK